MADGDPAEFLRGIPVLAGVPDGERPALAARGGGVVISCDGDRRLARSPRP